MAPGRPPDAGAVREPPCLPPPRRPSRCRLVLPEDRGAATGGWCSKLNGCFAELLRRLGYPVELLSCRTLRPGHWRAQPRFRPLDTVGARQRGGLPGRRRVARQPTDAAPSRARRVPSRPRPARIETDATTVRLFEYVERSDGTAGWELQYQASRRPRRLAQYEARTRHLESEPGLSWTDKPLVTRATSAHGGRLTLHRDRLRPRNDDLSIEDRSSRPTSGRWNSAPGSRCPSRRRGDRPHPTGQASTHC